MSPEGKGAQGRSAGSHSPRARPGDGGPGGCPSWGGGGRRVPAGAPRGRACRSVGAAAVGADTAVRRRGVRGPGRLPARARAPAQPAAPRRPVTGALARAHACTLPGTRLLRLGFPSLLARARPRPGRPRGRRRPPLRCYGGGRAWTPVGRAVKHGTGTVGLGQLARIRGPLVERCRERSPDSVFPNG